MVRALVTLALVASAGAQHLTTRLLPVPRRLSAPNVDAAQVRENTRRYEEALAAQQLQTQIVDTSGEVEGLIRLARAQVGPVPSFWERFGMPVEPTAGAHEQLHAAANEVRKASDVYATATRQEREKLQRLLRDVPAGAQKDALRERIDSQLQVLDERARQLAADAEPIARGFEQRGGSFWQRLGYIGCQLARIDGETRLAKLETELKGWGEDREPEILGAALTYIKGALSTPPMPDGGMKPAYLAGDTAFAPLGLEDAGGGTELEPSADVTAEAQSLRTTKAALEYVKNTLQLDWYAGCEKDANEVLHEGRGNDVDLAVLLVGLLRAQGTDARYVMGTIQLPVARMADLMGLLDAQEEHALFAPDGGPPFALSEAKTNLVLQALGSAGIAFQPVIAGGQVIAVQLAHTWVEAYIPYADYRGVGTSKEGMQWVPLEPSIPGAGKYIATEPSVDGFALVGANPGGLTAGYLSIPTTASMLRYVEAIVGGTLPAGTTLSQSLRTVAQQPEALNLIPGSLPYEILSVQGDYAFLPDSAKHHIRLTAQDATGNLIDVTVPLHRVTGHRTTFTFQAATAADERLVQSSGGVYSAPAAAVQVLLAFHVDGVTQALATRSVGLGSTFTWTTTLELPSGGIKLIQNPGIAGNLIAVGVGGPTNGFVEAVTPADNDLDGDAPRFLYAQAANYANAWTASESELAQLLGVVPVRPTVNVVFVENQLEVDTVAGIPSQVVWKGLQVDADLRTMVPLELKAGRGAALLQLSGFEGSFQEQSVLAAGTGEASISAVTVLQQANAQGVPVATLTPANVASLLPGISAPASVLADVADQLAQGRVVQIPIAELTLQNWTGTGYISLDPATNEGGYFLSGIVSGAETIVSPGLWSDPSLVQMLEGPEDPLAVQDLTKIARILYVSGDLQQAPVGSAAPKPVIVAVVTQDGHPVVGAPVQFFRSSLVPSMPGLATDMGTLNAALGPVGPGITPARIASQVHGLPAPAPVLTDRQGFARVYLAPDPIMKDAFLTVTPALAASAQEEGYNAISASVTGPLGDGGGQTLVLSQPVQMIGLPGPASQLIPTIGSVGSCSASQAQCPNPPPYQYPSPCVCPDLSHSFSAFCGSPDGGSLLSVDGWPALPSSDCLQPMFFVSQSIPNPFGYDVQDEYGNPLANRTVQWTQTGSSGNAGLLFDPERSSAPPPLLYDPFNALETSTVEQNSPTSGEVDVDFYAPLGPTGEIDLLARAGAATAAITLAPVLRRDSRGQLITYILSLDSLDPLAFSSAGIYGNHLLAPVSTQILRLCSSADGGCKYGPDGGLSETGWQAVRGDEPDFVSATVTMTIVGVDGQPLASPETIRPGDNSPDIPDGGPFFAPTTATSAAFWPRYLVPGAPGGTPSFDNGANELIIFTMDVMDVDGGHFVDTAGFSVFSGAPQLQVVTPSGGSIALATAGAFANEIYVQVTNPAAYPLGLSLSESPSPGSTPPILLPGPDVFPRLAGLPTELSVRPLEATVFAFPVSVGAQGVVVFSADAFDPFNAGVAASAATAPVSTTLSVPINSEVPTGFVPLIAKWILPVRNFESTAQLPDGGYLPPDPNEFPMAIPATLRFGVTSAGAVTVLSGGVAVASEHVDLDPSGFPSITPSGQPPTLSVERSTGLLEAQIGPGDPTGQLVEIDVQPDGTPSPPVQRGFTELATTIEDTGVAPIGHTFVKGVSVADGHLMKQFEDLKVPGRNGGLEFSRTYTSRGPGVGPLAGPLGSGWTHNYRSQVLHDPGQGTDRYLVVGGDGAGQSFICTTPVDGGCESQHGQHGRLHTDVVARPDGGSPYPEVVYVSKNGTEYHYGQEVVLSGDRFLLTSIVDAVGNTTHLTLEGQEFNYEVQAVVEPAGRSLVFGYLPPAAGVPQVTLSSIQLLDIDGSSLNVCLTFQYDAVGNLAVVDRHDGDCQPGSVVRSEKYGYDATQTVAQLQDNLLSYIDANARVTTYTYYQSGDALSGESEFVGFGDKQERVKQVIEPQSDSQHPPGATTFTYSLSLSNPTVQTTSLHGILQGYQTSVQGPRADVPVPTVYLMDPYGTSDEVQRPIAPGLTAVSSAKWDPVHRRKTSELDARGRMTSYAYDDQGNMILRTIEGGALGVSGADPGTAPLTDGAGVPVAVSVERWGYEPGYSALVCHVDPEGRVTVNESAFGLTTQSTRYANPVPQSTLSLGPDCATVAGLVQPDRTRDIVTQHSYCGVQGKVCAQPSEVKGDLVETLSGSGTCSAGGDGTCNRTDVLDYDIRGNADSTLVYVSSQTKIQTTLGFDGRSRLMDQSDTVGHQTHTDYDALDRVRMRTRLNPSGTPTSQVRSFDYYDDGKVRDEYVGAPDAPLYTRHTDLDGMNRPSRVTESGQNLDPPTLTTSTIYDEASNSIAVTDRRGVTAHTVFDYADRPVARYVDLAGDPAQRVTTAAVGVAGAYSANQVASYGYDLVGNKVTETDLHGFTTTYQLDPLYRVVKVRQPAVPGIALSALTGPQPPSPGPDMAGGLPQAESGYPIERLYDRVGNKTQETDGNNHTTFFTYDFANRLHLTVDPAGRTEQRDYDFNGNVSEVQTYQNPGADHLDRMTSYDGLNRPLVVGERVQNGASAAGPLRYTLQSAYDDSNDSHSVTTSDRRGFLTVSSMDALDQVSAVIVDASAGGGLVRNPDNGSTAGPVLGLTTLYGYDTFGNRIVTKDPLLRVTNDVYDGLRRLVERDLPMGVMETFAYDGEGHVIGHTDRRGVETDTAYDVLGRKTELDLVEGTSNGGKSLVEGRWSYFDLNVNGLVKTSDFDSLGHQTDHYRDALSREVATVDALGEMSQARFDAKNQRATRDRKGYATQVTYDAADRLLSQQDFDLTGTVIYPQSRFYDDNLLVQTSLDREQIRTDTQMDGLGRTTQITRSGGTDSQVTITTYDGDSNAVSVLDADQHTAVAAFDGANRKLSEDRGHGASEHELTSYTYDAVGNQLTVQHQRIAQPDLMQSYDDLNRPVRSVDALGNVATRAFDGAGNKVCEMRPLGGDPLASGAAGLSTQQVRDAVCGGSYVTQYTYDEESQFLSVTDALGGVSSFVYDEQRNLLAKQDANANLTTFEYDALNRRTAEHQFLDAEPRLNPANRDTMPRAEGSPDPVGGNGSLDRSIGYDANGNVALEQDPKGQATHSIYGILNRLVSTTYEPAGGQVVPNGATTAVSFVYYANGELQAAIETKVGGGSNEETDRVYDGLDRLQTETRSYLAGSKETRYAYTPKGNRQTVTDADGVSTHYTFDAVDRISGARIDGLPSGSDTSTWTYYPDGLAKTCAQPNGITETRSYDDASRLTELKTTRGGPPVSDFVYGYDANGNRSTLNETRTSATTQSLNATESTRYTYDLLDRLATVAYPDHATRYVLDAVGNRIGETEVALGGATTSSVTAAFNRADWLLARVDTVTPAADVALTWDLDGNLTQEMEGPTGSPSATKTFAWDVRNTLASAAVNGATAGAYSYEWNKQRSHRETVSEHVDYVLDDKFVLQEANSSLPGDPTYRRYHYAAAPLAVNDNGTLEFITNDAQGSVSDITALSGSVVSAEQYDAWGQYRNGTAPTASQPHLGYTGHQFDVETGLVYARARYYDPALGIFLSQDPREAPIGDAPWLNRYLYVKGNPTRYEDPDGLAGVETEIQRYTQRAIDSGSTSGMLLAAGADALWKLADFASLGTTSKLDKINDLDTSGSARYNGEGGTANYVADVVGTTVAGGVKIAALGALGEAAAAAPRAATLLGRVEQAATLGAKVGATTNALDQATEIAVGQRKSADPTEFAANVAVGTATGGATAVVAEAVEGLKGPATKLVKSMIGMPELPNLVESVPARAPWKERENVVQEWLGERASGVSGPISTRAGQKDGCMTRCTFDVLSEMPAGDLKYTEVKTGPYAKLTGPQTTGFPKLEKYGGVVTTSEDPVFNKGQILPPGKVRVVDDAVYSRWSSMREASGKWTPESGQ